MAGLSQAKPKCLGSRRVLGDSDLNMCGHVFLDDTERFPSHRYETIIVVLNEKLVRLQERGIQHWQSQNIRTLSLNFQKLLVIDDLNLERALLLEHAGKILQDLLVHDLLVFLNVHDWTKHFH